jgi:hypothetical protein
MEQQAVYLTEKDEIETNNYLYAGNHKVTVTDCVYFDKYFEIVFNNKYGICKTRLYLSEKAVKFTFQRMRTLLSHAGVDKNTLDNIGWKKDMASANLFLKLMANRDVGITIEPSEYNGKTYYRFAGSFPLDDKRIETICNGQGMVVKPPSPAITSDLIETPLANVKKVNNVMSDVANSAVSKNDPWATEVDELTTNDTPDF